MNEDVPNWVDIVKNIDPVLEITGREFSEYITDKESAIPRKYKELILLACLAAIRHGSGIRKHGYEAMHHGASDKEIMEALALASLATSFSTLSEGVDALANQFTIQPSLDTSTEQD